jgi:hypothetical protein
MKMILVPWAEVVVRLPSIVKSFLILTWTMTCGKTIRNNYPDDVKLTARSSYLTFSFDRKSLHRK